MDLWSCSTDTARQPRGPERADRPDDLADRTSRSVGGSGESPVCSLHHGRSVRTVRFDSSFQGKVHRRRPSGDGHYSADVLQSRGATKHPPGEPGTTVLAQGGSRGALLGRGIREGRLHRVAEWVWVVEQRCPSGFGRERFRYLPSTQSATAKAGQWSVPRQLSRSYSSPPKLSEP